MLLNHFRVTYDIVMGAWAGGQEATYDFRFTDEIIKNKDYALIVGMWKHLQFEDTSCISGSRKFAQHLKHTSKKCKTYWVNDGVQYGRKLDHWTLYKDEHRAILEAEHLTTGAERYQELAPTPPLRAVARRTYTRRNTPTR